MTTSGAHSHDGPHDHVHAHDPHDAAAHPVTGAREHTHDPAVAAVDDGGADLLDLDGEVLHGYWDEVLDLVTAAVTAAPGIERTSALRVVDLGAGTGTGALGLARRLPAAGVVAVDVSDASLARVDAKAGAAGLGERVRTVVADLDGGWPELGPVDLTWASMSLHHLADPAQTLGGLRDITRSGGLVAVAEFDEPLRFLPEDLGLGRPGLETRLLGVLSAVHTESVPTLGSPWATVLDEAGWSVVEQHDVVIDDRAPAHPLAGRYARTWFARLAQGLGDRLDADDERTLAALLADDGPHAILERTELHLRGVRTVTIARA